MTDGAAELWAAELGAAALGAAELWAAELGAAALGAAALEAGMTTMAAALLEATGATTGVATATAEVWVLPGQLVFSGAQDVMVTISVS